LEHGGFGGEEEIGGEMGAVDVVLAEGGVGIGDAYELDLGVGGEIVEEALDLAVDQADYGYTDGRGGLGGGVVWGDAEGEETGGEEEFGEAHGGVMVLFELVRAAMNDEPVSRMGNSCDPVEAFLVDQGEELE
jgi:hypothetical protein